MNSLKIRKSGTFYNVFDNDCYILYFFFNYNIKNQTCIEPIINKLEEFKINYEVIGGNEQNNFKNLNKYEKYVLLGKEKYEKDIKYADIVDKLHKASEEKLDKILENIERILDE